MGPGGVRPLRALTHQGAENSALGPAPPPRGLDIRFDEGGAEALPYPDAAFGVVASLIGAMFAPRPERFAAEFVRVCWPGGAIAMANWTPGGFIGKMFRTIAGYVAPSGMPSPVMWGAEDTVRERLRDGITQPRMSRRMFHLDCLFPPEAVADSSARIADR